MYYTAMWIFQQGVMKESPTGRRQGYLTSSLPFILAYIDHYTLRLSIYELASVSSFRSHVHVGPFFLTLSIHRNIVPLWYFVQNSKLTSKHDKYRINQNKHNENVQFKNGVV